VWGCASVLLDYVQHAQAADRPCRAAGARRPPPSGWPAPVCSRPQAFPPRAKGGADHAPTAIIIDHSLTSSYVAPGDPACAATLGMVAAASTACMHHQGFPTGQPYRSPRSGRHQRCASVNMERMMALAHVRQTVRGSAGSATQDAIEYRVPRAVPRGDLAEGSSACRAAAPNRQDLPAPIWRAHDRLCQATWPFSLVPLRPHRTRDPYTRSNQQCLKHRRASFLLLVRGFRDRLC